MGAASVRLESESAVDTMDFVNKIVNGGNKKGELPSKSTHPVSNNLGAKIDEGFDFNFPQIPPYEGIQENILKYNNNANNSALQKQPSLSKPDIFGKGY